MAQVSVSDGMRGGNNIVTLLDLRRGGLDLRDEAVGQRDIAHAVGDRLAGGDAVVDQLAYPFRLLRILSLLGE
jgi:hypothetical protein